MFHSTRKFQLWQYFQKYDEKFWINFISQPKIDEASQFFMKRNILLKGFLWARRMRYWLENFYQFSDILPANLRKQFIDK